MCCCVCIHLKPSILCVSLVSALCCWAGTRQWPFLLKTAAAANHTDESTEQNYIGKLRCGLLKVKQQTRLRGQQSLYRFSTNVLISRGAPYCVLIKGKMLNWLLWIERFKCFICTQMEERKEERNGSNNCLPIQQAKHKAIVALFLCAAIVLLKLK